MRYERRHMVRGLDQLTHRLQPTREVSRRRRVRCIEQRLAGILRRRHRYGGTCEVPLTAGHPAVQPPLERSLDRRPVNWLDVDQFEQAFPVVVGTQWSATLRGVQQRPQRAKFCLEPPQRRLALDDSLARHIERRFRFAKALLDDSRRLVDIPKFTRGSFGGAAPAFEVLAQGAVPEYPRLQLCARLLLLFGQKLLPALELSKLRLDRRGFSLQVVALLLPGDPIGLEGSLRVAPDALAVRRSLQLGVRRFQLNPGTLDRAGKLIDDPAAGQFGSV